MRLSLSIYDFKHRKQLLESSNVVLSETEKELKRDKERLSEEFEEIILQKEKAQNDLKDWMANSAKNVAMINTLEQKIRQIASEKRDYELLLTRY